jgi:excisionase family DNA binding protein
VFPWCPVTEGVKLARYLTPSEAADLAQLSVKTILKAIRERDLVAARFGNRVRISPSALRRWLERAEGGSP